LSTNFKTLFKLFSIFLYSFSFANTFEVNEILNYNSENLYQLNLQKRSFITGSFKATSSFETLELLDKNRVLIKSLMINKKPQGNFYFVANYTGKYYLKIKNRNKQNRLKLKIDKIFHHQKEIKPQNKIISAFLKQELKNIEKTKNSKAFWEKVKKRGTPLIEHLKADEYILTFLHKGLNYNVKLIGGPTADYTDFIRYKNSDIWYKSFIVKKGIRMSYQIATDIPKLNAPRFIQKMALISNATIDPFNKTPYIYTKEKNMDKYHTLSTFFIKDNKIKDWGVEEGNKKGEISTYNLKSKILNNSRNITIYKPHNYNYKKEHDILFVFDGENYQNKINTTLILDNLIANNKIKPTIAIFINNASKKSRSKELPPNKKFAKFMVKELFPFIKTKVKFTHKSSNTIITGSSYGGLASSYIAFLYPDFFGKVLSQSGSYWWAPKNKDEAQWLTKEFSKVKKKDIKFYLNAGTYETGFLPLDILETNRHFRTVLVAKNYDLTYEEFIGGHDYFAWKIYLANGLIALNNK
jgi:enterochelin esterase family protein